ncbi:MAG TPA: segregation/condensation protein A, partial [Acidimicrobiaceae bacterium]|nr:segregation/condensation protein A [Acidimicrobiaceae bacterium]
DPDPGPDPDPDPEAPATLGPGAAGTLRLTTRATETPGNTPPNKPRLYR